MKINENCLDIFIHLLKSIGAKIVVSMELTDQVVQNNVNVGMMHTATQKMVGVDATMVLWANYVKRLAPKEDMEKIVSKSVDVLPIILKCVVMWMVHVIVYQVVFLSYLITHLDFCMRMLLCVCATSITVNTFYLSVHMCVGHHH